MQGKPRKLFYNQVVKAYDKDQISERDYQLYLQEVETYNRIRKEYENGLIDNDQLTAASARVQSLRFAEIKNNEDTVYLFIKN